MAAEHIRETEPAEPRPELRELPRPSERLGAGDTRAVGPAESRAEVYEQAAAAAREEYLKAIGGLERAEVRPSAGVWDVPPPRHHGDPFNQEYEQWVRTSTGGPPDLEYRVQHGDNEAWFDASRIEDRDGTPAEVLIDAKGHYAQFLDPNTGDWRKWWRESKKGVGSRDDLLLVDDAIKRSAATAG